ncbi:MAG: hypothetical protein QOE61_3719, partial [Micromonosporaceae bacterium]|nr:hypothetical protein [Micromonosporaceae bacterium]
MTANSKVTTDLVESRRRSPAHLGAPLRRVRLHARLAAARAAGPVTVVVAPAGAGKTTLLADWASLLREEEQPPVRVAWLTADRDEGDPHLFWLAMIESLRNAGVAVSDRPGRAIRALAPARCVAAVGMLVDEIAAHADPLVCILDRHDQLTDPDVTSGLLAFAAALPLTVHMVIAHDAPDETEALRGPSGGLGGVVGFDTVGATVVAADELSFDPDEAVALVGLRIPTSASTGPIVASVAQRSAVGLVLAAVAAQGRRRVASTGPPPPRGNKPASPRRVDAVTADALARITDRQYQFLVETSLLEAVSAPLADAVRGGRDSARILGQLVHRGLPLEALATDGTWYRYHPVLRGTLLTRLWADPVMARSRFGRAAGWYAAAGEPEPAVRCAVAAGDHERAARFLADSLGLLVERRSARSRHVLGDLVDRRAAAREPQVCLMMAAALVEDGRPEAAEAWLDSLDLLDGGLDGAATVAGWHSMRAAAATVRAANWRVGTEPERRIVAGREAVALQAGAGGRSWIAAQVALGSAQIGLGRMDDGMQTLAAALGHAAEVKVPLVASLPAAGTLASALVARHRSGEARML